MNREVEEGWVNKHISNVEVREEGNGNRINLTSISFSTEFRY